ncbi:MAG: trypsin-like peptidase domain-containing protein [Candidatus Poribacteria bacterium]|nr:trypsin-like peptidase domain-containing protein [Candidatus Poribacteria bacterium]MDE0504707.1 trypsin-like peptidase domain-containing protein [Candidatus Poribacteria bacterium]
MSHSFAILNHSSQARKNLFWCIATILVSLATTQKSQAAHNWTDQIAAFKPMVVNVETSSEVVFETEAKGTSFATGFIVDEERGIIATNRHVTGSSPSYVKINFYDGSFTEAKVFYYDPTHDFGFYQINPEEVEFSLEAVQLGAWRDLALGDELLLIGNNEKEEYSIKEGKVANLNVNKGNRHSSYIHTTFDRTGGSSGSPVWNTEGRVIAIHARGTDTSSFELPVEYLIDALTRIQNGVSIHRGEIGVDLELISIGEAIKHFRLPESSRAEIGPSESGTPKVIQVESIIPRTTGENFLRASDIIYRINDDLIRDDLYTFDSMLNGSVGSEVVLEIYRNGEQMTVKIPVEDLELKKVRRFVRFAGSIFHDITPDLRRMLYFEAEGAYLPHADAGSSFSRVGIRERSGNSKVVIQEINGRAIHGLDDFIASCMDIADGQHTYVVIRDFNRFDSSPTPKSLTVNLQFGPLQVFEWNEQKLDWKQSEIGDLGVVEID